MSVLLGEHVPPPPPPPPAEVVLVAALTRILATHTCPKYLRDAASAWLAAREDTA